MTMNLKHAALAIVTVLVMACGPTAKERVISTTLSVTQATQAGLVAWDDLVQDHIVDTAVDEASGQAALAAQIKQRDVLIGVLAATYEAIAVAAMSQSDQNVAVMLEAAGQLWDAYRALIGVPPPTKGK